MHRVAGGLAMLPAAAEDLHEVGQHRFVADLGKADRAEAADVGPLADTGFGHRKDAEPAEIGVAAASGQSHAVKSLPQVQSADARHTRDRLARRTKGTPPQDLPRQPIGDQPRQRPNEERRLHPALEAHEQRGAPRLLDANDLGALQGDVAHAWWAAAGAAADFLASSTS